MEIERLPMVAKDKEINWVEDDEPHIKQPQFEQPQAGEVQVTPHEAELENLEEQNVVGPVAKQVVEQIVQEESVEEKDKDITKVSKEKEKSEIS